MRSLVDRWDEPEPIKAEATVAGDRRLFDGLILDMPPSVDVEDYITVVIW